MKLQKQFKGINLIKTPSLFLWNECVEFSRTCPRMYTFYFFGNTCQLFNINWSALGPGGFSDMASAIDASTSMWLSDLIHLNKHEEGKRHTHKVLEKHSTSDSHHFTPQTWIVES